MYTASKFSSTLALLGTAVIWVFFPILTYDYRVATISSDTPYTGAYTMMYCLASSTAFAFAWSVILNKGLMIRDIVCGPIAGGVAGATASYYVTNPVYGILIGMTAGTIQVIIMNKVEKNVAREKDISHTFSFTLFGVQGMIGAIFAAPWNAIVRTWANGFTYDFSGEEHQVFSWVISLISMPMGIIFGVLAGVFIILVSGHTREDHFNDYAYWLEDDGISYIKNELAVR